MTAKKLVAALQVLDENILFEASRMAVLFSHAARYRVDAMRRRSQAEAAVEAWAAQLSIRFRAKATGERKTEAYFKARITLNSRYRLLNEEKEEAEYREELAKLILDAYRMRRDAIKIIADHRGYEGMREESMLEHHNQVRRMSAHVRQLDGKRKRAEKGK